MPARARQNPEHNGFFEENYKQERKSMQNNLVKQANSLGLWFKIRRAESGTAR